MSKEFLLDGRAERVEFGHELVAEFNAPLHFSSMIRSTYGVKSISTAPQPGR
jgi:hypothetical protein